MTASSSKDSPPGTAPSEAQAPAAPGEPPRPKSGESVDPLVGRVISDRFRVIAPIARGGMGVVYRAEQAPLGRLVALKVLSLGHDEDKDPEFRRRFFLEAATVANLTHPNTVTVFDYGQAEGRRPGDPNIYYIAMELVHGRTLKKAIASEGPFDAERAVHVAKQICRSLREAHRQGVIHRDMKPGNVMLVDRDGEDFVKVLDFGLVKELKEDGADPDADLTQAGVFMGSPKYMSPEQIQGEPVDARSDIYAIGVVLYEMLTGRVPFQRDNPMQILMDHVRAPVPPLAVPAGKPPVPADLASVVYRCLEKSRDDRFADMDALLIGLKAASREGNPSHTREISLDGLPSGSASLPPSSGQRSTVSVGRLDNTASGRIPAVLPSSSVSAAFGAAPTVELATEPASKPSWQKWAIPAAIVAVVLTVVALVLGREESPPAPAEIAPPQAATTPARPREESPATSAAVTPVTSPSEPTATTATAEPTRSVMLSLRSQPVGAMVMVGDREFGPTPTQVELTGENAREGAQLELVFRRTGFRETRASAVVHGGTVEVDARLPMLSAPPRRPTGGAEHSSDEETDVNLRGYRDSPY
jgi:eukaryotic-like serine/threonine-protein kinase